MGGQDRKRRGASDNPFWDFSLAVYNRAGVAAACLALQDRRRADVNVLLFCAWAGSRGHTVQPGEFAKILAVTQPWQETVVMPLRAVRRRLKEMAAAPGLPVERLRAQMKALELQAEEVEQRLLYEGVAIAGGKGAPDVSGANMVAYFAAVGAAIDAADVANLAAVLRGCYPGLPPLQAVWAVTG